MNDPKLTPPRPVLPFSWRAGLPISIVMMLVAAGFAVAYSLAMPHDHERERPAANGTFTTDHLVATSSIQLNAATPTTLGNWNGSKQLGSYAGSASNVCAAGSAASSMTLNPQGSAFVTCITAGAGTVTSSATAPNIAQMTTSTNVGNYAGSASNVCGAGSAASSMTLNGQGSAFVTCIAAGTGTVTSTATAPNLAQMTSGTNVGNYAGSASNVCGAGSAAQGFTLNAQGSASASCAAFVPAATAAISLANGSPPASVNFSTEGTIDWFIVLNSNSYNGNWWINNLLNNTHTKRGNGNLVMRGWGNSAGASGTSATYGTTMTSTASDDSTNSAASLNGITVFFGPQVGISYNTCADTAFGSSLKLRIYSSVFGATVTTTAHLTISGTTATDTYTVAAVQTDKLETITFTGGAPGDKLCVNYQVTTNPAAGSISLGGMTLGVI